METDLLIVKAAEGIKAQQSLNSLVEELKKRDLMRINPEGQVSLADRGVWTSIKDNQSEDDKQEAAPSEAEGEKRNGPGKKARA